MDLHSLLSKTLDIIKKKCKGSNQYAFVTARNKLLSHYGMKTIIKLAMPDKS